jgi:hypothetical protein
LALALVAHSSSTAAFFFAASASFLSALKSARNALSAASFSSTGGENASLRASSSCALFLPARRLSASWIAFVAAASS